MRRGRSRLPCPNILRSHHELELTEVERKSAAQTVSLRIKLTVLSTEEKQVQRGNRIDSGRFRGLIPCHIIIVSGVKKSAVEMPENEKKDAENKHFGTNTRYPPLRLQDHLPR